MGFWIFMLICDLLVPLSLLIIGFIYMKKPPRKINEYSGYRTARSMRNNETWTAAQKIYGKTAVIMGIVLTLIAVFVAALLFNADLVAVSIVGGIEAVLQCFAMLVCVAITEKKLKRIFK